MSSNIEIQLQIIFEEYKALRAEIQRRSRDQLTCVQTSLVSIGTLTGVVTSDIQQFKILLLIAPWILLTLGSLWCDHHSTIHDIGKYIKNLELALKQSTITFQVIKSNDQLIKLDNWGWETTFSKVRKEKREKILGPFTFLDNLLPLFYFLIPSILSIIAYGLTFNWSLALNKTNFIKFIKGFDNWTSLLILIVDIFLVIIFCVLWKQAKTSTTTIFKENSTIVKE